MTEYLVRWKYAANSLVNTQDVETNWYEQFHSRKNLALNHYASLLDVQNCTPAFKLTVEIFRLAKLIPGDLKSEHVIDDPQPKGVQ